MHLFNSLFKYKPCSNTSSYGFRSWIYIPRSQGSCGQHGAHLGPVGPRWAPCWPHEPCYQGSSNINFPLWLAKCTGYYELYQNETQYRRRQHGNNKSAAGQEHFKVSAMHFIWSLWQIVSPWYITTVKHNNTNAYMDFIWIIRCRFA